MNSFVTNGKATVKIKLVKVPVRFEVYRNNDLFYFRDLTPAQKEIIFNIALPGNYTTNCEFTDLQILPLKVYNIKVPLPEKQKDFSHLEIKYQYNPTLQHTPARHFYKIGLVEYGNIFLNQPYPLRVFILLHEKGHTYYHNEEFADLYAVNEYLKLGYNKSTAIHALTDILKEATQNNKRVDFLLKAIG